MVAHHTSLGMTGVYLQGYDYLMAQTLLCISSRTRIGLPYFHSFSIFFTAPGTERTGICMKSSISSNDYSRYFDWSSFSSKGPLRLTLFATFSAITSCVNITHLVCAERRAPNIAFFYLSIQSFSVEAHIPPSCLQGGGIHLCIVGGFLQER